jgi:sulfur relay (sulfurtransferase) DsrF/TusC family protein
MNLLIESRGPWRGPDCAHFVQDALALAGTGAPVHLVLIQDGVLAAVNDAVPAVGELAGAGAEVWVDRFSLDQRGLPGTAVLPAARLVDIDDVAARLLAPDVRAVWH